MMIDKHRAMHTALKPTVLLPEGGFGIYAIKVDDAIAILGDR
jgi:hypothetical protein